MDEQYLCKLKKALDNTMVVDKNGIEYAYDEGINKIFDYLSEVKKSHNALYICGNGGSAGIAVHMTADYLKNGGFNVRSLFNPSILTCIGNDLSYEFIFSKQIELMADKGDVLIAISSSGNSENITNAARTMLGKGGDCITFTGFKKENSLCRLGTYNVYVPIEHYGIVESIHNLILQQLVDQIVDRDGVALQLEDLG